MMPKSVLIVVHLLSESVHFGLPIQCFQCFLAERPYYIDAAQSASVKTCSDFDHSEAYVVDCPDSTFCFKKTVQDHFYNTAYVRQERGCAPQTYTGLKLAKNLQWVSESVLIKEAYKRGCRPAEDFGLRSLQVVECYCDGRDLCNSATKPVLFISGLWPVLILLCIHQCL